MVLGYVSSSNRLIDGDQPHQMRRTLRRFRRWRSNRSLTAMDGQGAGHVDDKENGSRATATATVTVAIATAERAAIEAAAAAAAAAAANHWFDGDRVCNFCTYVPRVTSGGPSAISSNKHEATTLKTGSTFRRLRRFNAPRRPVHFKRRCY
jgi:hypothetical protein